MPQPPAPIARSSSRSSKSSDPPPGDEVLAVGQIVGAHGLRGLIRIRPYHFPTESLAPGRSVVLERNGDRHVARITTIAPHGRGLLLTALDGVTDRTAAEALAGSRVLVRTADLPPPDADEYYHHEVTGYRVDTIAGRTLGTIARTIATGLNDVWIVRDGDREHLIPVIADVVREIDRSARRVLIEPLPGLLD